KRARPSSPRKAARQRPPRMNLWKACWKKTRLRQRKSAMRPKPPKRLLRLLNRLKNPRPGPPRKRRSRKRLKRLRILRIIQQKIQSNQTDKTLSPQLTGVRKIRLAPGIKTLLAFFH